MDYLEVLHQMLETLQTDAEKLSRGELQDYLFCSVQDKEYGIQDANYVNRTRACYALLYLQPPMSEKDRNTIIETLLLQEIISRENDSFQGIGVNLELLSALEYQIAPDCPLFARAKDANFDCFCGYEPSHYLSYYARLPEELSLENCIDIARELQLTEYICRLVDIFKQSDLDISGWQSLKYFAKDTKRFCDMELAVTHIFDYITKQEQQNQKPYELLIAVCDYSNLLIQKEAYDQALEIFLRYADIFRKFNREGYKLGISLMQHFPACSKPVWRIIQPLIASDIENVPPIHCISVAECAERMGEQEMGRILREKYAAFEKEMQQLHAS